ncbi:OmpA domain protein [Smithella sp. ME-1]|uniref:Major porin and structural outer membrane porin oprf n=1 Tax=hydrocarbon metagenome TaxID=938273 RepID=A0A0W8FSQ3_9ZZZZ|nr:OmpA domain protein [Smithella sp. ME-1]
MKKIGILAIIIMLMAVVTAAQAEVRAGGLPELQIDKSIKDCGCPPCCPEPVVAPPPPPPPPPPAPIKEKVTITLNVQFDTNKADVKEQYNDEIKRVADFMKEFPDTTAEIGGHTDNVASAEYNQKLSEKRANSVRQYLIDKFGIDGSRLTAVGYGLDKPVAGNDTEEGRQQNRRVEAVMEAVRTVYK